MVIKDNSECEEQETHLITYLRLRKFIGGIGLALPLVLLAYSWGLGGFDPAAPTISHFYHTVMRNIFVGSLCAIGVFMFSYNGYKKDNESEWLSDRCLGIVTGVAVICVALFPTDLGGDVSLVGKIHFIAAALFLFSLGLFSISKFTRSRNFHIFEIARNPAAYTERAKILNELRYKVYLYSGFVIWASLAVLGIGKFMHLDDIVKGTNNEDWAFWFEAFAVWAFGVSWLTKGEAIEDLLDLKDRFSRRFLSAK